jgi:VWFA-related protein
LFFSLLCISQNSRIHLDVRLVLVTVTVTDSHNRFVQGLQKKDFQIWEDKIEQAPVTFSNETTPVTLGIILDKSGSMGGRHQPSGAGIPTLQDRMITTATSCLRDGTREDEYFLVEFSSRPMVTADFTSDISRPANWCSWMPVVRRHCGTRYIWASVKSNMRRIHEKHYWF